jgi:lysyl-tRNA synthetase class I
MRGCAPSSTRSASTTSSRVSTDYYTSGRFDATLLRMLERFDAVMAIMLPSLREERARPIRRSCRSPAHRRRAAGADRGA